MPTPNINKILRASPVSCARGAPLGAGSFHECGQRLYLQRVRLVDGCYAPDGTYWGAGVPLWCAFNTADGEFATAMGTRIYTRAITRQQAKQRILDEYRSATFVFKH